MAPPRAAGPRYLALDGRATEASVADALALHDLLLHLADARRDGRDEFQLLLRRTARSPDLDLSLVAKNTRGRDIERGALEPTYPYFGDGVHATARGADVARFLVGLLDARDEIASLASRDVLQASQPVLRPPARRPALDPSLVAKIMRLDPGRGASYPRYPYFGDGVATARPVQIVHGAEVRVSVRALSGQARSVRVRLPSTISDLLDQIRKGTGRRLEGCSIFLEGTTGDKELKEHCTSQDYLIREGATLYLRDTSRPRPDALVGGTPAPAPATGQDGATTEATGANEAEPEPREPEPSPAPAPADAAHAPARAPFKPESSLMSSFINKARGAPKPKPPAKAKAPAPAASTKRPRGAVADADALERLKKLRRRVDDAEKASADAKEDAEAKTAARVAARLAAKKAEDEELAARAEAKRCADELVQSRIELERASHATQPGAVDERLMWPCQRGKPAGSCLAGGKEGKLNPYRRAHARHFRPTRDGPHGCRVFDAQLLAFETALANGGDGNAELSRLRALGKNSCSVCRGLAHEQTLAATAPRKEALKGLQWARAKGKRCLGGHCKDPETGLGVLFTEETKGCLSFQHNPEDKPTVRDTGRTTGSILKCGNYDGVVSQVADANQCEDWCLMCNITDGAIQQRLKAEEEAAARGLGPGQRVCQYNFDRKQRALDYVLSLVEGKKCAYADCNLVCTRENKPGFVLRHTPDGRLQKWQHPKRRDQVGVAGICNTAHERSWEATKTLIDDERKLCHREPACQNCHKIHETDKGL